MTARCTSGPDGEAPHHRVPRDREHAARNDRPRSRRAPGSAGLPRNEPTNRIAPSHISQRGNRPHPSWRRPDGRLTSDRPVEIDHQPECQQRLDGIDALETPLAELRRRAWREADATAGNAGRRRRWPTGRAPACGVTARTPPEARRGRGPCSDREAWSAVCPSAAAPRRSTPCPALLLTCNGSPDQITTSPVGQAQGCRFRVPARALAPAAK